MKCYLNPESIEFFFEFKKTLLMNDKYISESGMRGLYACLGSALDNCKDVSKINKISELFDIINLLVEKKIFTSEDGKVIPTLYMLAVKTSAYLKDPVFIEKMFKEFFPGIAPDQKDNLGLYASAYLHYSKNEFDEALMYINRINIHTFQMKYHLRNLQIIITYEKNDYNMFLYILDTHKHFLSKNKSVSDSYKESNMKFLNYTNSLFKLRDSKNRSEIKFLEKTILKDVVVNKHWLIEKIKKLSAS